VASYSVYLGRAAEKELDQLAAQDRKRLVKRAQSLAGDPRPVGSEKLSGEEKYRLRQGDFRIVYSIDDAGSIVMIVKIAHRRDVSVIR
jgi:mRNA interferase RelE/StbE